VTTVQEFLERKGERTERELRRHFAEWDRAPARLLEAMEYSLFGGGKRLRPALALGACEIVCGDDEPALPAACAIELIHVYSLVHDDLPCMDDDDLRRGRPTAHRVFGDALAILAGDSMLTMAFDIAADTRNPAVIRELARAAGVEGMAAGQVMDLDSENKQLGVEELRLLHARKTGALIRAAVRVGALLARASEARLSALSTYGEYIGLAFQIADDILDVTGDEAVLGKPVGSDAARRKSTYPAAVGLERARQLADEAAAAACAALRGFGPEAEVFRMLARYVVDRDR
jgi:geranylgeranyl diphosphate synthase type II